MRFITRTSFWVPLVVVTVAAVGFSFMLAGHRAESTALRQKEVALRTRLRGLEQQNAALREERNLLLTDVAAIERVAREEYGFAAPGEMFAPFDVQRGPAATAALAAAPQDACERVLGTGRFPWAVPLVVFFVSAAVLAALECAPGLRWRGRLR